MFTGDDRRCGEDDSLIRDQVYFEFDIMIPDCWSSQSGDISLYDPPFRYDPPFVSDPVLGSQIFLASAAQPDVNDVRLV